MTSTSKPRDSKDLQIERRNADIFVLGGGPVGAAVARRLEEANQAVTHVDRSDEPSDSSTYRADPTDATALLDAGLEGAHTAIVATRSDSRNLLAAQLSATHFDVDRVLVLTNEPDNLEAIADSGHEPVCATTVLATALLDHL